MKTRDSIRRRRKKTILISEYNCGPLMNVVRWKFCFLFWLMEIERRIFRCWLVYRKMNMIIFIVKKKFQIFTLALKNFRFYFCFACRSFSNEMFFFKETVTVEKANFKGGSDPDKVVKQFAKNRQPAWLSNRLLKSYPTSTTVEWRNKSVRMSFLYLIQLRRGKAKS